MNYTTITPTTTLQASILQLSPQQQLLILRAARTLISNRVNWCKRISAITESGTWCHPNSPNSPKAVAWCAYGAIVASSPNDYILKQIYDHFHPILRRLGFRTLSELNDKSSHEEVLAVFDEVIANFGFIQTNLT